MRTAGGGIEHLTVDGIVSLLRIKPFGCAPSAFACATQVEQEQQDRCCGEDEAQRFPRRAMREEPADHRWPRFQSSSRAWIETAMPISAMAISTQRKVSR